VGVHRDQVERVYSQYARVYDRVFGKVFQESREAVIRNLTIEPGERLLEVGVGTGLCLPLYPAHASITAIDLSAAMVEKARERVEQMKLRNVTLAQMDAANMQYPDDSFDVVVAAYVVTAVPDHRSVMSEMIRVSKPGGRLVLLNHFTNDSPLISVVEKAISPLCAQIGFRTDLSVADVLDGWPLLKERDQRVSPLRMWHVVECINAKRPPAPGASPAL
jgi:phosphatidylethanolamine/phosphatidyl-N-methylethanolamine N-methyltransferase